MKSFIMVVIMFLATGSLTAQDEAKKAQETPPKDVAAKQAAMPTYKVAFSIYELQEGKKVNQREYSLFAQADDRGAPYKLKIGTKVPIEAGPGQITYADVGLNLECSVAERLNNKLAVWVEVELSNFAIPEQNSDPRTAGSRPVLRAVTQRVRTVLTPGKPQVITSMDDVNSNKRLQVEMTATKID